MNQPAPSPAPANSRLTLMVASLAQPLAALAGIVIAVLLIGLGVAKLLPPGTVDSPTMGQDAGSPQLLMLASGGVVTAPWGSYLIGTLQCALGVGLLVPAARAVASLGCLLVAAAVAVGFVMHWNDLSTGRGLTPAGVSLLSLFALLLAAAALGARSAAKRVGASA